MLNRLKMRVLVCGLLCLGLSGVALPAMSAESDYYKHILVNGKLQRFNDSTKVIYYRLDALENSKNWDYTKWNFIKDEVVKQAFQDWEMALNGKVRKLSTAMTLIMTSEKTLNTRFEEPDTVAIACPS